jgi:hypothetical protein
VTVLTVDAIFRWVMRMKRNHGCVEYLTKV